MSTTHTYYYVVRVGYKFPTVKHVTLTSAVNEAERLCNQHPGETFEILQCLAVTRAVLAKTSWLDGVTPPSAFRESSRDDQGPGTDTGEKKS
jgi:hypothetical protein